MKGKKHFKLVLTNRDLDWASQTPSGRVQHPAA